LIEPINQGVLLVRPLLRVTDDVEKENVNDFQLGSLLG
jgi:hypothetical protein